MARRLIVDVVADAGTVKQHSEPAGANGSEAAPPIGRGPAWGPLARIATVGIFFILLVAALELARPVLLPVVSAFVIGFMLGPLSARAARWGVPDLVSALVFWLLVVGAIYAMLVFLSAPLAGLIEKAPEIGQTIKDRLHVLDRPLAALEDLRKAVFPAGKGEAEVKLDIISIAQPTLTYLTPALGQIVAFLGTLFFFLLGRTQLRQVLVIFFEGREARLRTLRILNDVEQNLTSHLSVVTVINLFVGVGAGIIAYLVGLPNAVAWGVLAFILNFIPYLGALIMQIVLLAVGLITFPTLGHALIAPLAYLVFTTIEGHFVTPGIMGKRLLLNPLIVFLALVFWTWLWGPIGAFLAVPILIITLVAINHLFPKDEPELPG